LLRVQGLERSLIVDCEEEGDNSNEEESGGFRAHLACEVAGDPADALDDEADEFGGGVLAAVLIGEQFEQDVDDVLGVGVLEEAQHDAIDRLYEVVAFVVDVAGT
jgi:hypothetical protein